MWIARTTVGLALFLGASPHGHSGAVTENPAGPGQGLAERDSVAREFGLVGSELAEGRTQEILLPALGATLRRVKAVERGSGEIHSRTTLDGRPVTLAEVQRLQEDAVAVDPTLKMDESLRTSVQLAATGELLPVVVWLRMDLATLDAYAAHRLRELGPEPREEAVEEAEADIRAHARVRMTQQTEPFAREMHARGIPVRYVSTGTPVVVLQVNAAAPRELAARPDVQWLFLERDDYRNNDIDAQRTHRTGSVNAAGVDGSGITVAMLEDGGLDPFCPYLSVAAWFYGVVVTTDHVHATAGCVASTKPDRPGAAPGATLLSANTTSYLDSDILAAADWITTQDADITNMSFGSCDTSSMLFLDHVFSLYSRIYRDSYISGAGNSGACSGTAWVGTPAKAYNVIAVGNIDNNDTAHASDDAMNNTSCWVDPANGLGKPNLAAVGTSVDTLSDSAPWEQTTTGSSLSGPYVAGNLANAMQVNSKVRTHPEAAMALMMATAWNNIEGSSVFSSVDGAGGLHGRAAYECADDGRVLAGYYDANDFNILDEDVQNIWLEGGERTRVCFAYSCQFLTAPPNPDLQVLTVDFDISIREGQDVYSGMPILASSSSLLDNYEILEFVPPTTGWYSVMIDHNNTLISSDEPWGLAWTQESDTHILDLSAQSTHPGKPLIPGAHPNHPYPLEICEPAFPNRPFAIIPSLTQGDGTVLGGGKVLPLEFDVLTNIWLGNLQSPSFAGSVGTLGPDGKNQAKIEVLLPSHPVLNGKEIHLAPVLFDVGGIQEIGELHTYTLEPRSTLDLDGASAALPLPFAFTFFGKSYHDCFVNRNGTITFGAPDADSTPSDDEFLGGPPRIALAWGDYALGPAGRIEVAGLHASSDRVTIFFERVTDSGSSGESSFKVHLHANGDIEVRYAVTSIADPLVGISPGHGASLEVSRDFTSSGSYDAAPGEAILESFLGEGSFDLGQKLVNGVAHWNTVRYRAEGAGGYELQLAMKAP